MLLKLTDRQGQALSCCVAGFLWLCCYQQRFQVGVGSRRRPSEIDFCLWICLASIPMPSSPSGMNCLASAVNKPLICLIGLAPLELWYWQNSRMEWCCCIFILQSALTYSCRKELEKRLWALGGKGEKKRILRNLTFQEDLSISFLPFSYSMMFVFYVLKSSCIGMGR